MSDTTLNRFLASGTMAQRLAFVPSPPTPASGPSPTYIWTETDTGNEYWWNITTSAWVAFASQGNNTSQFTLLQSIASGTSFAAKGNTIVPEVNIAVTGMGGWFSPRAAGGTYEAFIALLSGPGSTSVTITSIVGHSNVTTNASATNGIVDCTFATPVLLNAGSPYALLMSNTAAATGTTVLPLGSATSGIGLTAPVNPGFIARVAQTVPVAGAALDTNSGASPFNDLYFRWHYA